MRSLPHVLLVVILITAALASPSNWIFPVVRDLSPRPSSWVTTAPLETWEGFSLCPDGVNYQINFTHAMTSQFNAMNATIHLERLDPTVTSPSLCSILLAPPLTVSYSVPLLPNTLTTFIVSGCTVADATRGGVPFFDLANIPPSLKHIEMVSCGLDGTLDFTNTGSGTFLFSDNVNIRGAIDLVQQGICNPNSFQIDLRGTSLVKVFAYYGPNGANCVGTPSEGQSFAVEVDPDVNVTGVDPSNFFTLSYGYYCSAAPQLGNGDTSLPLIEYYHANGRDAVRIINNGRSCATNVTRIFATIDMGYIFDSTAYWDMLSPCLDDQVLYAVKRAAIAYEIAFVFANGTELIFGQCPGGQPSPQGDDIYMSVSISEQSFMSFISTGLSVTSHGIHFGNSTTCLFPWHYFVSIPLVPNTLYHLVYNEQVILKSLEDCFPRVLANGDLYVLPWTSVTLTPGENHFQFTDSANNVLSMNRFSYSPVYLATYCYATPQANYQLNVSTFAVTLTVLLPSGAAQKVCTYNGIFQFMTQESPTSWNTLNYFESVMTALAPCMPTQYFPDGNDATHWTNFSGAWDSTASRVELAVGSFIFGDILFADLNNASQAAVFSNATCSLGVLTTRSCGSVDLYFGALTLEVDPLSYQPILYYYQNSVPFVNITYCTLNVPLPLWFTTDGTLLFPSSVVPYLNNCAPSYSNTALFDSIAFVSAVRSPVDPSLIQEIVFQNINKTAKITLTSSSCRFVTSIESLTYCPSITETVQSTTSAPFVDKECYGDACEPYHSIVWGPQATNTGNEAANLFGTLVGSQDTVWRSGEADIHAPLPLWDLARLVDFNDTIDSCYPSCVVEVTNCAQVAFVINAVLSCYISKGTSPAAIRLPNISDTCANDTVVRSLVSFVERFPRAVSGVSSSDMMLDTDSALVDDEPLGAESPTAVLQVACLPDGSVALLTPTVEGEAAIAVIAGSSTSLQHTSLNITKLFFTSQFAMHCSVCTSLYLRGLYPTPLVVIAMNAALNVLLVLIANFVIEPIIGKAIVKVKVIVMASLGAISRREVHSREAWLRRCLRPMVVGSTEVLFHIDSVLKVVNVERQRMRANNSRRINSETALDETEALHQESNGSSEMPPPPTPSNNSAEQLPSPSTRTSEQSIGYGSPRSRLLQSGNFDAETVEDAITADERFCWIYENRLMGGQRMLGSVGEGSLRKLVELREACRVVDVPRTRTALVKFPLRKAHRMMSEMTAHRLLQVNAADLDDTEGGNNLNTQEMETTLLSGNSNSTLSFASSQTDSLELEDCIAALENDVTAEWIPFVLPNEWLDRQFLLPRDWLLALQSLFVIFLLGHVVVEAWRSTGAEGAWETYSAVFFFFLGCSAPSSLLVNSIFRIAYGKRLLSWTSFVEGHSSSSRFMSTLRQFRRWFASALSLLYTDAFFMFSFLLLIAPFSTHCLAGLVLFPFLIVIALLVILLFGALRNLTPDVNEQRRELQVGLKTVVSMVSRLLYRQAVMFSVVATLQFSFSYAMMYYADTKGELGWVGIVEKDFTSRRLACTLESLRRDADGVIQQVYAQIS